MAESLQSDVDPVLKVLVSSVTIAVEHLKALHNFIQ